MSVNSRIEINCMNGYIVYLLRVWVFTSCEKPLGGATHAGWVCVEQSKLLLWTCLVLHQCGRTFTCGKMQYASCLPCQANQKPGLRQHAVLNGCILIKRW